MLRKILVAFLAFAPPLLASEGAYLIRHGTTIVMGNQYLERIISISPNHVGTVKIVNKLSDTIYKVHDSVFGLQVVFSGLGPAPTESQNGENDPILTARDFNFTCYTQKDVGGGGKELALNFSFNWADAAFRLRVMYEVYPGEFSFRKWLQVSDSSWGIQFLDRIYVESMSINPSDFSHGQFGQPVFDRDIFMGVEYPTAENVISGNHVMIGYVVGQDITRKPYVTHKAILGPSPSSVKLEQTFMSYVKTIEIVPPHPYLLYNSWYDLRNPAIADGDSGIMNEQNTLQAIESLKTHLYDKYDIHLNGFVLDDGWDNYNRVWEIDSTRFPHGFSPLVEALNGMNTRLGLWASPFGGYSNRDLRVKWAAEHGYETTGDYLDLAGPKYKAYFQKMMDEYAKVYHIGYFKWDGLLLASNSPGNGHLPGIYSREEELKDYIDIMKSVRKVNPDIFLNITSGTWLSPWWLRYANCIWMQGEDYGYQESVPSINDRDKAILYKDAVLWDNFRKSHLLFPVSGLMTHGIIRGRYNLLGGVNESLASFSDEAMMYFGRGVMMWELYVTPDLLSSGEWSAIASAIKWAKANQSVLDNTRMVLGDPNKRHVYGYIHLTKEKGILLLRNPYITDQNVDLKLTPNLGDIDPKKEYYVKVIYPYNYIFPKPVKVNQVLSFNLDGYEVLTAELIPVDNIDKSLPVGIRYATTGGNLTVYDEPGRKQMIRLINGKELGIVKFGTVAKEVEAKVQSQTATSGSGYDGHFRIAVPEDNKDSKFAFLLQTKEKLQGRSEPEFSVEVNGIDTKTDVVRGDGTWFWVLADLDRGQNSIDCSIKFKKKDGANVSFWVTGEQELVERSFKDEGILSDEVLPAKPYPASVQKRIIPVSQYTIR